MTILIPGIYGLDAATAWRSFSKDPQKYIDRVAKDKSVQKEITYFNSKAEKFANVDELLKDRRALQYLLNAYGLGSEINNVGRIKKILTEDPTAENALANRLLDQRFKNMAISLRLDEDMSKLKRISFRDTLQDKYVQNELEVAMGQQDPALRQAAYFARNAGGIKDVYSVLGDKILREVVQGVYNLPAQMAIQPVETQARTILGRVDVTKFTSTAAAAQFGQGTLTSAKSDYSLVEKNLAISDAARAQVKIVQDTLDQLVSDYGVLDTITDPLGSNSATITLQQTAVPQVIGFEQQLNAGKKSLDSIDSLVGSLVDLIAQAQDSNNVLADLKTQFNDIITAINNKFSAATATLPDGTTGNILLNGTNETLSAVLNDSGKTVTINRYDTSGLQGFITSAQTAFNAIVDSSDETNILAANSALLVAADQIDTYQDSIATDIENLETKTSETVFAATLNTTSLLQGKRSIDDGLSHIAQIEELLAKIDDLAHQAQGMDDSADHSELEASFLDYRTQIRDLITTAGAGLDNFLNNSPGATYTISTGQTITVSGGYDLLTSIADVLDAGSLSTQADAATLRNTVIQVTNDSDDLKASLNDSKKIMDRIVSVYDPRAKLDLQVYELQETIESLVAAADVNGINLLNSDQTDIKLQGLSSGANLTFTAQPNFLSTIQTGLSNIVAQFGNTTSDIYTAVHSLSSSVDSVKTTMDIENRRATMEYGRIGAVIDTLTPKDTSSNTNNYKVNSFTEKFLTRFLTLNGQSGFSASGGNSYLVSLFGGGTDTTSAINTISSLSIKI